MAKLPVTRPSRTGLPTEQQADALYQQALAALKQKQHAQAISHLTAALRAEPLHINALMLQARVLAEFDKYDSAIELMQLAVTQQPDEPEACFLLARWLTRVGRQRMATAMMHRAVQLRPNHDAPRRYLAALYGNMGHDEQSQYWAKKAIRSKAFSVREAKVETKLTVLALFTQASGSLGINRKTFGIQTTEGHNNLAGLLDSDHITVIRFHVDTLDQQPELLRKLPAADVIYNSITDPERCEHALHLAQKVCDRIDLPVINEPRAVLAASREGNYQRFKDNPDVILPKSVKVENTQASARAIVEQAIKDHGFELPVIIRLAGYQGGKFMHKVDDLDSHDFTELDEKLAKEPQTAYVIQYHDVSYIDERLPETRLYPKFRAFMVGNTLYPAHIYTADHYNVHHKLADPFMHDNRWLLDEERDFCENPVEHLGKAQWQALEAAMRDMGMGYNGVDFAPSTDPAHKGELVVFEINPAMRNWVNQLPEGDHVQQAWNRITQAAHQYFVETGDVDPWAYVLPKGQAPQFVIPTDVECHPKQALPHHGAANQAWLAERLGDANDFSDSAFFDTRHYIDEALLEHTAREQGIQVTRHPGRMLTLTQGQQQTLFYINAPRIPLATHLLDGDKAVLKALFTRQGLPTPTGRAFNDIDAAYRYFAACTVPQVVKPINGFASRGVSVHVSSPDAFRAAWQKPGLFMRLA
ncbi:hypothetical protein GCM10022228_11010 [Halomonas cibimaris]|uniref:ATP-grasp domain-containing protein n=1 Tax=Halomonas cibimaris TaxID=657012 RepID=A0ABP7LKC0_9GAMM